MFGDKNKDFENAKKEINDRKIKPNFAPGQKPPNRNMPGNLNRPPNMGGPGLFNERPPRRNNFGGPSFGGPPGSMNNPGSDNGSNNSDKVINTMETGFKESVGFFKQFINIIKSKSLVEHANFGSILIRVGIGTVILNLILMLFKFPLAEPLFYAGLISVSYGIIIMSIFSYLAIKKDDELEDIMFKQQKEKEEEIQKNIVEVEKKEVEVDDIFNDIDEIKKTPEPLKTEKEKKPVQDINDLFKKPTTVNKPVNTFNKKDNLTEGLYTRSILFDLYKDMLQGDGSSVKGTVPLKDTEEDYIRYHVLINKTCEALGLDIEDIPTILEAERSVLVDKLTLTRPSGKAFNLTAFIDEFNTLWSFEEDKREFNKNKYAKGFKVGNTILLDIYGSREVKSYLKDTLITKEAENFVLNQKKELPVFIGFDKTGKSVNVDFYDEESLIITGQQRFGKSWLVKSIISQLSMYKSPKELNFFIADVKPGSDFKDFDSSHKVAFAENVEEITSMFKYLIEVEAPRRQKILNEKGHLNIKDYNKNEDEKLPFIYIIIDEMIMLNAQMKNYDDNNKTKLNADYRNDLLTLATAMPNMGYRLIMISHTINNSYIPKTISDLVSFKFVVGGDEELVSDTLGIRKNEFPHALNAVGNCAIRTNSLENVKATFAQAYILASNNTELDNVFKQQKQVWDKLEPGGNDYSDTDVKHILNWYNYDEDKKEEIKSNVLSGEKKEAPIDSIDTKEPIEAKKDEPKETNKKEKIKVKNNLPDWDFGDDLFNF